VFQISPMGEIIDDSGHQRDPHEIVEEAINEYGVTKFYVLTSGGNDSMVVDHFIRTNYPEFYGGRVFTVTGYGSRET